MVRRRYDTLTHISLSLAAVFFVAATASAQPPPPDNTKVNTRDRAKTAQTADQQKNNRSDVAITRDIRRAIVADKNLSTYAHNVKVITQNGEVTLKGPVKTEDEKKTVEAKAVDVAGAGHVKNEMSITTATSKTTTKHAKSKS